MPRAGVTLPLLHILSHEGDTDLGFEGAVPREGDVDVVDVEEGEVLVGEGEEFMLADGDKAGSDRFDVDGGGFGFRMRDEVVLDGLSYVRLVAPVFEITHGKKAGAFGVCGFVHQDALCDDEAEGVVGCVPTAVSVELV